MTTRDWGGLGGILEEARAIDEELRQRPRVACPRCGTPLDLNDAGWANCPLGHYRAYAPNELD